MTTFGIPTQGLHASLTDTAILDKSEPAQRSRAVSKAMAYINETSGVTIEVRYACSNTGVALRILYRAFRERFGIGPKACLLQQRLSNVRAELLRAARFTQHRTYAHCRCGPAPIPYMRHPANQPGS